MLNNCTGLKNFDGKQDFVKKIYMSPKRENASKRKMRIKPLVRLQLDFLKSTQLEGGGGVECFSLSYFDNGYNWTFEWCCVFFLPSTTGRRGWLPCSLQRAKNTSFPTRSFSLASSWHSWWGIISSRCSLPHRPWQEVQLQTLEALSRLMYALTKGKTVFLSRFPFVYRALYWDHQYHISWEQFSSRPSWPTECPTLYGRILADMTVNMTLTIKNLLLLSVCLRQYCRLSSFYILLEKLNS